ncbi:hypothetical protein V7101_15330, partial [Bacillus velezensis]|uniref:hypothetical protein n=1 Tax=Bacillus velezensis TaxID=492670 RepID=UPI003000CFCA
LSTQIYHPQPHLLNQIIFSQMILRYGYGAALNILSSITGQLFCIGNRENSYDILFRLESFCPKRAKVRPLRKMKVSATINKPQYK